jgi:ABC-type antimicrobial peptide transport system permease subunit
MVSLGTATGDFSIIDGVTVDPTKHELLMAETTIYEPVDIVELYGIDCEVVGIFSSDRSFTTIVSNALMQEAIMTQKIDRIKEYNQWGSYFTEFIYLYGDDPDLAVTEINALDFTAENTYDYLKAQNRAEMFRSMIFVIIGFMAIIIYIIFMMRSSMLSRIKEIGIYRSIGATKRDIYKIFFSEILAFTTIGSLTGYLIMTYIVFYIQGKFEDLMQGMAALFSFPLWLFFAGITGIYVINILFGMIPIFTLLRKTPSEINSKYDI